MSGLRVGLAKQEWILEDPGIRSRPLVVDGSRWALVEYEARARRPHWCDVGHRGFVLSGAITYEIEEDPSELTITAGDALLLRAGSRHRGRNDSDAPARLFLIDD